MARRTDGGGVERRRNMTETVHKERSGIGGAAAVMLLTAGVLVLAGRMFPLVGDAVALVLGIELLVLGIELLVLGRLRRDEGPLIAGALLTGVGSAILLAAGPLQGRDADTIGGAFVLAVGCGFGLVALLTRVWLHKTHHWSWITAVGAGVLGAGLLTGPDNLASFLSWVVPVGLLVAGAVLAVGWWRRRSR
jgi:uncharacterized membrane protein HdeD (DUF308 family)